MNSTDKEDIEEIKKTVQYYIDAVAKIDPELVKKAWHNDGTRIFVNNDDQIVYLHSPTKDDVDKIKESLKQTKQSGKIENIDIYGTAAVVKVKWFVETPNWTRTEINFLSLLKAKEKWIIVSKIAHGE